MKGLLGHHDFSPEETLAEAKNVDPHLVPRAPMSNADIDVHLLNELGKLGLKRGKLITPQSHPELMEKWHFLCQRAGMKKPPQLILVESKAPNALTVTPEEVVVTTGLFKMLNLREVSAVLGHELGHEVSDHKRPRILATSIFGGAGAIGGHYLGQRLGVRKWSKGSVLAQAADELFFLLAGGAVGSVVANNVAVRPTELDADAKGAQISGDPEALISALQKLQGAHSEKTFLSRLAQLRSGYPSTETRIERLREIASRMHSAGAPVVQLPTTSTPPIATPGHAINSATPPARLEQAPPELALN